MQFSAAQFLAQYGYLAVFIGSVLEGETILLLAGFAAHQGYLSLPMVMAVGFCGGVLGDQTFFFLGLRYGRRLLSRFPRFKPQVEKVQRLIERYHSAMIVMVRFMYGLRFVGPVAIGASRIKVWRFVAFNVLGGALWAVLVGGAGYLFGQALGLVFADLKRYEHWAALALVMIAAAVALVLRARRGKS